MDRVIVYEGEIPYEEDLLQSNRFAMIGLAKLAQAILGSNTLVNGLACTPTAPASMEIQVAPGELYSLQNLDDTAYSSLPADTDHAILKQGLKLDTTLFACGAPATAGHRIDYLVQAAYLDVDAEPAVLPYYDTNHPDHPYSGPNNSGEAQPTVRKGVCHVSVKAGVAAPSGQQHPPAPDAGTTGLYLITVAHGQTSITEHDIRLYPDAPFITETLTQKISHADVDERYARKATTLAGYGITDAVNIKEKAQPGGVATLDENGHVPGSQLPALDSTPPDGSITEPKIADGAVTNPKLADGAVTKDKISGPLYAPTYEINTNEYIEQGNGDGASGTVNNLVVRSWQGIGLGPSIEGAPVPRNEYAHWFNVRTGDMGMRGSLSVSYWLHILNPADGVTRAVHHSAGTIGFVGPNGWIARFKEDGNFWTPAFGWLSDALSAKVSTEGNQTIHGNLTVRYLLHLYDPGNHTTRTLRNWNKELQLGPPNAPALAVRDDGTLWSRAHGQLHDYFANKNELNAKQPAGNYVFGDGAHKYALAWRKDDRMHVWVNDTPIGFIWTSGNFDPSTKADVAWVKHLEQSKADRSELDGKANARAECRYNSGIWDFGRMIGNETHKVQDLPEPWVATGLTASWLTNDRLHGIGMRARKIRNQ